jgi:hypothetical protein
MNVFLTLERAMLPMQLSSKFKAGEGKEHLEECMGASASGKRPISSIPSRGSFKQNFERICGSSSPKKSGDLPMLQPPGPSLKSSLKSS